MENLTKRTQTGMPQEKQGNGQSEQAERFVQPRASVYERGDNIILNLEMPGVTRDKIEVTVEKDELTVTGWRQVDSYEDCEVLRRERLPVNFRRTFVLSENIDTGKISASCDNGVLSLTLPKSEGAKPRKIEIQ